MTSFNIASIPDREDNLLKTIESIYNQVDRINICLNNYKKTPLKDSKINYIFSDNKFGDGGKFMFTGYEQGYYFTGDDDLIYSSNYVEHTINNYNNGIVTYHGRTFDSFPIKSYYNSSFIRTRCLDDQYMDVSVQFGGTGCMMFDLDIFCPKVVNFERKNMADIWIGVFAKQQNIPILSLKHKANWIKYQNVNNTIWGDKHLNDVPETAIVNKFFT